MPGEAENGRLAPKRSAPVKTSRTSERLAYALHQVPELRQRIPLTQAAAPGGAGREPDPLEQLFAAIRPAR